MYDSKEKCQNPENSTDQVTNTNEKKVINKVRKNKVCICFFTHC